MLNLAARLLTAGTLALAPSQSPSLPAIAQLDCAPWDGPAFSIAIGREGAKTVDAAHPWLRISIWHDAAARHGATYRFPDTDGKTGAVEYRGSAFPSVTGTVTFPREVPAKDIDGSFDLVAPDGRHLSGRFHGGWSPRTMMCGVMK
ncbi:MAG: hypothetical protein ABI665_02480 [Vicinamibacterales bacterium]